MGDSDSDSTFERRFLDFAAASHDVPITAANVAYQLDVSIDDAKSQLARLVERGVLRAADASGAHEMPYRPSTPQPAPTLVSPDHRPAGDASRLAAAMLVDLILSLCLLAAFGLFAYVLPGWHKLWIVGWMAFAAMHEVVSIPAAGPPVALALGLGLAGVMAWRLPAAARVWAAVPAALVLIAFVSRAVEGSRRRRRRAQ